jgi:hypothetical protein
MTHSLALLLDKECDEFRGRFVRALLGEEVAAVECAGPEIGGALSPDPWDVERIADPGLAPEHEGGTPENGIRVGVVMEEVD